MLTGVPISPGFALGKAFCLKQIQFDHVVERAIDAGEVDHEINRFHDALRVSKQEIEHLLNLPQIRSSLEIANIFDAHLTLLEDPDLNKEVTGQIRDGKKNTEAALRKVILDYSNFFKSLPDPQFQGKAIDILDVGQRILKHCHTKGNPQSLEALDEGAIIVADDLTPSDLVSLDQKFALGIAISEGTPTSHASILARSLGIPALIQVKGLLEHVTPGQYIILDCNAGHVHTSPTSTTVQKYRAERDSYYAVQHDLEQILASPSVTSDGVMIKIMANAGQLQDLDAAVASRAAGIGLFRTEFIYLTRRSLPTEDELLKIFQQVVTHMPEGDLVFRTIDLGGDKLPQSVHDVLREKNPELGWRSIRMALDTRDVLRTQLRALLRLMATAPGRVKIMFPMISNMEEVEQIKELLQEVIRELSDGGLRLPEHIPVGCMIEVPSAALLAHHLAQEFDFMSIGSNDLIQYTMAVDRTNPRVAHLYQPLHPAILRLIRGVVTAAEAAGTPLSICGEMAGDERYTAVLLGLGLRELSMNPISLTRVKKRILEMNLAEVSQQVLPLLELNSATAVEAVLRQLQPVFDGES